MATGEHDRSAFVDATFEVLADRRRRLLLWHLEGRAGETTVDELADWLVEQDPTCGDRETAVIDLYHRSLPILAESDVVDYDSDEGTVALTTRGVTIARIGRTVTEHLASV
jgi:hypothetical protein